MTTTNVDAAIIEEAAEALRNGGLVAYPTDTVYGLAALPEDHAAVESGERWRAAEPTKARAKDTVLT